MANKTVSELQRKTIAADSDLLLIENATATNSIAKSDLLQGYAKSTDLHKHDNKPVLDQITQTLIDKWNGLSGEIENLKLRINELENRIKELESNPPVVEPDPEPPVVEPDPDPEPPVVTDPIGFANNIVYGYYMGYGDTVDPKNINIEEINEATTVMTKASVGKMGKTSICPVNVNGGVCPTGATFFVIIPAASSLVVTKDNGIGGKVSFNEDLITEGYAHKFGCNAVNATLNGVFVKIWGEFMTTDTQLFMYVD